MPRKKLEVAENATAKSEKKTTTSKRGKKTESAEAIIPVSESKDTGDIPLSKDLVLKRDASCMWIERLGVSEKTGKPTAIRVSGYYGKMCLCALFESFARKRFKTIDASGAEEYLRKMKEVEAETKAMIKNLLGDLERRGLKL